ncbi:MAG: hypothetical protein AAB655_01740 [Patescibacteria group bacterium]
MELLELLKELKTIEPDREFSTKSRNFILNEYRGAEMGKLTFWQLTARSLETATSLALAVVLVFMILGGFSAWKFVSPSKLASSLDPASLRAEADAIDIQIQLTNLNISENLSDTVSESTKSAAGPVAKLFEERTSVSETSSTDAISIEEALQLLSE